VKKEISLSTIMLAERLRKTPKTWLYLLRSWELKLSSG